MRVILLEGYIHIFALDLLSLSYLNLSGLRSLLRPIQSLCCRFTNSWLH